MHHYAVVYRRVGEGFSAHVPALTNCRVYGATLAEAEHNVHAAIQRSIAISPEARCNHRVPAVQALSPSEPVLPLLTACGR